MKPHTKQRAFSSLWNTFTVELWPVSSVVILFMTKDLSQKLNALSLSIYLLIRCSLVLYYTTIQTPHYIQLFHTYIFFILLGSYSKLKNVVIYKKIFSLLVCLNQHSKNGQSRHSLYNLQKPAFSHAFL